jgi:signal transduction histidine kinase
MTSEDTEDRRTTSGQFELGSEVSRRQTRHEVRNLLNSIQLNTHLLLRAAVSRSDRVLLEQNIASIKAIDYQLELLRLLGLADANQSPRGKRDHLSNLVRDGVEAAEQDWPHAVISISGLDEATPQAMVDAERFSPAFHILLRHAVGQNNGSDVMVEVQGDDDLVRLTIEGTGPRSGRGRPPQIAELVGAATDRRSFPLDIVIAATLLATERGGLTVRDSGQGRAVSEVVLPV